MITLLAHRYALSRLSTRVAYGSWCGDYLSPVHALNSDAGRSRVDSSVSWYEGRSADVSHSFSTEGRLARGLDYASYTVWEDGGRHGVSTTNGTDV